MQKNEGKRSSYRRAGRLERLARPSTNVGQYDAGIHVQ